MRLSTYAKQLGISYQTAWRLFKDGKLNAYKLPAGTVIVREEESQGSEQSVAIYCRVSSSENKGNLESQKKRLLDYCAAKGYKVSRVITEVGSGINDTRKQWLSLLQDRMVRIIVVEHKDRFTRFGFAGYKTLLNTDGRDIEVVECKFCHSIIHADVNAPRNLMKRSSLPAPFSLYMSHANILRALTRSFLDSLSSTERKHHLRHSDAVSLLPADPYFAGNLAQLKGH